MLSCYRSLCGVHFQGTSWRFEIGILFILFNPPPADACTTFLALPSSTRTPQPPQNLPVSRRDKEEVGSMNWVKRAVFKHATGI